MRHCAQPCPRTDRIYGEAVARSPAPLQPALTKSGADARHRPRRRITAGAVDAATREAPAVGRALRHAREHQGLTLRAVERITGRSNAYLSQVERGLIKRPDPLVLLELADLYRLDFAVLAKYAGLEPSNGDSSPTVAGSSEAFTDQTFKRLLRLVKQLDARQRAQVLAVVEDVLRSPQHPH